MTTITIFHDLPAVSYDRSARVYVVPNQLGEAITFPAGREGYWAAHLWAINVADPDLYDEVRGRLETVPYLKSRLIKAAGIVTTGGVMPAFTRAHLAEIRSTKGGSYALVQGSVTIHCPCTDFADAPLIVDSFQRHCKHVLAWQLYETLQNKRL